MLAISQVDKKEIVEEKNPHLALLVLYYNRSRLDFVVKKKNKILFLFSFS